MSLINLKGLNEASGEVFPTVPAGQYKARITNIEDKVTKEGSHPMLKFTVKLVDEKAQNQVLSMYVVLPREDADPDKNEMSLNRIKRIALACNVNTESDSFDTSDFMGCEFMAQVSLQEKDGRKQNDIKDQLAL
jgi:hypothetical protein